MICSGQYPHFDCPRLDRPRCHSAKEVEPCFRLQELGILSFSSGRPVLTISDHHLAIAQLGRRERIRHLAPALSISRPDRALHLEL
jgi:hypothetical protein